MVEVCCLGEECFGGSVGGYFEGDVGGRAGGNAGDGLGGFFLSKKEEQP